MRGVPRYAFRATREVGLPRLSGEEIFSETNLAGCQKLTASKVVNRSVDGDVLAARNGADNISPANNANELIAAHHGDPFDMMGCHQLSDLFHRSFFVDADNFLAHD